MLVGREQQVHASNLLQSAELPSKGRTPVCLTSEKNVAPPLSLRRRVTPSNFSGVVQMMSAASSSPGSGSLSPVVAEGRWREV